MALVSAINNCTLTMKYIIIILALLLASCVTRMSMPEKEKHDVLLTTRGHGEDIKKDPN